MVFHTNIVGVVLFSPTNIVYDSSQLFVQMANNVTLEAPADSSRQAMDAGSETYEETDHYEEAESWVCVCTRIVYGNG